VLSLVNLITDVPLQRSIPVRVPGRGGGFGLEASVTPQNFEFWNVTKIH
jgi:hypothetical protein